MKLSNKGIEYLKFLEGFRSKPYLCQSGVATIGYGTTIYPDGKRVKLSDPAISRDLAESYLLRHVRQTEIDVTNLTRSIILSQNQFDALVLFAYNVGTDIDQDLTPEGLGDSTLLKKVLANPQDPAIKKEFMKWIYANKRISEGLKRRRKIEADIYFNIL